MILLLDNYDSFTYNIYQYLSELTEEPIAVRRNDKIDISGIEKLNPSRIIISPGPGRPEGAGVCVETVKTFAGKTPILGVCLGHQVIAHAFGARIIGAKHIVHGKAQPIRLDGRGVFRSIPDKSIFTRYHSLAVDHDSLPREFEITARSEDAEIMGIRHTSFILEGVQFHPESIAAEHGKRLLKNFLSYRREPFPLRDTLVRVIAGEDLSIEEAADFMTELTDGDLDDIQVGAYLTALNAKGIKPEEIAGCASVLQKRRVVIQAPAPVLDTCGTGGDGLGTFNISSLAALTASACGATVAKHGNRAVSSLSGSADFYKELGMRIDITPRQAEEVLKQAGFVFLFAPVYHGAMRFAAPARRSLGIKTIMNLLGPLVNPAAAAYQVIGVFSDEYLEPMARAAMLLGIKRVLTVRGMDGQDEISVTGPTRIVEAVQGEEPTEWTFRPEDAGITPHSLEDLRGGSAEANAKMALEILEGSGNRAVADAVALNAGAGLTAAGISNSIAEGYTKAMDALESGAVREKLRRVIAATQKRDAETAQDGSRRGV